MTSRATLMPRRTELVPGFAVVFFLSLGAITVTDAQDRSHATEPAPTAQQSLSPDDAIAYDGCYVTDSVEYRVTHEGIQVYVSFDGNARVKLLPVGPDRFVYQGVRATIAFVRGPDGKVADLYQNFGGMNVTATRKDAASGSVVPPSPVALKPAVSYNYHKPIEPTYRDLAYATESPAETLDLYLPAAAERPCPVVIWIHGGGFMVGDKRSMPRRDFGPPPPPIALMGPFQIQVPDAAALTEKGYAVVSLNYRLLMKLGERFRVVATAAVQDAKAAVRFLRANAVKYNLDPEKFAVWGNSAGGYTAAMLGVTGDQPSRFDAPELGNPSVSSAVQAVVAWYGAIDDDSLLDAVRFPHYLGTAKVVPPFLIANGDADRSVSAANAQQFDKLLREHGHHSTLTILRGAAHEDPAFMATQMEPTFRFLDDVFGVAPSGASGQSH